MVLRTPRPGRWQARLVTVVASDESARRATVLAGSSRGMKLLKPHIDPTRRLQRKAKKSGNSRATAEDGRTPDLAQIAARLDYLRAFAQRCARDAASFIHPQLADIKHDHRTADGELIKPIIEIIGYPGPKEIAPPTPALTLAKGKH